MKRFPCNSSSRLSGFFSQVLNVVFGHICGPEKMVHFRKTNSTAMKMVRPVAVSFVCNGDNGVGLDHRH